MAEEQAQEVVQEQVEPVEPVDPLLAVGHDPAVAVGEAPGSPIVAQETGSPAETGSGTSAPSEEPKQEAGADALSPEAKAANALRDAYKTLPGVVPEVIGGSTVEEVQASLQAAQKAYTDTKAAVLKELGTGVPGAHGGAATVPVPDTAIGMIAAGLRQNGRV